MDGADGGARPHSFFRLADPDGPTVFRDAISRLKTANPHAACVDVHDTDYYANCDLYVTEDGRAGFAITEGDELVSVYSMPGQHAGDAIVSKAVQAGARRLDCYDIAGGLPRLYARHGFTPIARVPWDDKYAPDGWDYDHHGRPDVVAMAITAPRDTTPYADYDTAIRLARQAARHQGA